MTGHVFACVAALVALVCVSVALVAWLGAAGGFAAAAVLWGSVAGVLVDVEAWRR